MMIIDFINFRLTGNVAALLENVESCDEAKNMLINEVSGKEQPRQFKAQMDAARQGTLPIDKFADRMEDPCRRLQRAEVAHGRAANERAARASAEEEAVRAFTKNVTDRRTVR